MLYSVPRSRTLEPMFDLVEALPAGRYDSVRLCPVRDNETQQVIVGTRYIASLRCIRRHHRTLDSSVDPTAKRATVPRRLVLHRLFVFLRSHPTMQLALNLLKIVIDQIRAALAQVL